MKKRLIAILMLSMMLIATAPMQIFAAGQAPGKPTFFRAYSGSNTILLRWKKVPGATSYVIRYKLAGSKNAIKEIKNAGTPVPGYSDYLECKFRAKLTKTYVVPKYHFQLQAVNANGRSPKVQINNAEPVKKMYINVTFKETRRLTSHTGKKRTKTFKAGTTVRAVGYDNNGKYIFPDPGKSGELFYVRRISVGNAKLSQFNNKKIYSKAEAQFFVNQNPSCKSNNQYLIWVNTYTQRLYIFKGKKGSWKCIKSGWPVSTGKVSTPTATGMTSIRQKERIQNGTLYWNVCQVFSIHGRYRGEPLLYPRSSACVRNEDKNAKWIYNNIPKGTAVFVF